MSTLYYPNSNYQPEVDAWLEMKIYKAESAAKPGWEKGPHTTIRIVAPQNVDDIHGHQYESQTFKMAETFDAALAGELGDVGAAILREVGGGALSAISGDVWRRSGQTGINPFTTKLFEAPNFRTFTFRWELHPLTSADSTSLDKIVKKLTEVSYPEVINPPEGVYWNFPDQFQLSFVANNGDGALERIPIKSKKSVLSDINVNYTGAGQWRTTSSGSPSFVNLNLTFSEIQLRTQADFQQKSLTNQ